VAVIVLAGIIGGAGAALGLSRWVTVLIICIFALAVLELYGW
jgi:hypothetical protein